MILQIGTRVYAYARSKIVDCYAVTDWVDDPVNLTNSPGPAQEVIAIYAFVSPLTGAHVPVGAGGPDHHGPGPFKHRLSQNSRTVVLRRSSRVLKGYS